MRSARDLSAQWSSDLFLWGGKLGPWPDPAVRPVAGRNSNVEASNVPHFQGRKASQYQSLASSRPAAAAPLAAGHKADPAQGLGSEAPHFKPLGMLLRIGNRKVKTSRDTAVLDCAGAPNNLLLTIILHNAPESPEPSGELTGLIWGASPRCSNLTVPAQRPVLSCGCF